MDNRDMEAKCVGKINREDVVQAALIVERWCKENRNSGLESCDCPFSFGMACSLQYFEKFPNEWRLEEHLRTRGLKHG